MPSLKNAEYPCKGLNQKTLIGFLGVTIGAAGAPTVAVPCAGITMNRSGAGIYDFSLPESDAPGGIFVIPYAAQSTTVVGFRGGNFGHQVSVLIESGGTIAVGDAGNGDILTFMIFALVGPSSNA